MPRQPIVVAARPPFVQRAGRVVRRCLSRLALLGLGILTIASAMLIPAIPAQAQGYSVRNYDEDLARMRSNLDQFYNQRFPEGVYTAPGFSWVNEAGGTATACGNLEALEGVRSGAFYCPANKVVYLDYSFLRYINSRHGYDGVMAVMAHEWGHHAQNVVLHQRDRRQQEELEADCLAGATMRWIQSGHPELDLQTLLDMLAWMADEGTSASHGNHKQRHDAFLLEGWNHGTVTHCLFQATF